MVILMFTLFIMLSVEPMLIHFHGKIFGAKVPKRVSFFLFGWSAAWDKILTIDNLIKRGLLLVNWCCMCPCNGKI